MQSVSRPAEAISSQNLLNHSLAAREFNLRTFLLLSILLILLAACTPVANAPTATSTLSPTPYPTETRTPEPIPTNTPKASETPSPAPHFAAKILPSPSGEYVAKLYLGGDHPSGKDTIEISDKNGTLLWQIPYQGEMGTSDPRKYLGIFSWSNNSAALYFRYQWSPDGGDYAFWWDGLDLEKFDIATGNIQQILPAGGFKAFTISPDGKQLAYTRSQDDPFIIYVRNLSTGEEKTAYAKPTADEYTRVGNIHWSPSGKSLVFQTESKSYRVQTIYLDIATMQKKLIAENELYTIMFDGWNDDSSLKFLDLSSRNVLVFDLNTNEYHSIGTATPQP
jgi:WD40 repeat protein